MGKSLKYLADNLIISPDCDRRQLNLNQPDAAPLKERDIILASMVNVRKKCEVDRQDPSVHVIIFSLEGRAWLYTEEYPRKGRLIEPGQVVVLPAHYPHFYKMEGPHWKAIWFYLADTDIWHQIRDSKPHVRASMTSNELRTAMEVFWAESLRNERRARLAARHYAEVIVLNLERELDMEESPSNREMRQQLYKLWDTVGANLSRKWTVTALADDVGISTQHLYRVSMQLCGHKPMEMVTILRMRHAQELLISTSYMIKAIAQLVGYGDAFSFSTAFKKHAGCSPREFRNQSRKGRPEPETVKWSYHKIPSGKDTK
jgi:AraC-like DNA-binding protein/quercetin dioxygenase-like cupin family protein